MYRILDTGCGNGLDIISDALKNDERFYTGLDKEKEYFLDSPRKIYRFFIGQMVYRSLRKLMEESDITELPPTEVTDASYYLGEEYYSVSDTGYQSDMEAVEALESHKMGRIILDCPIRDLTMSKMEHKYSEFIIKNYPEILDMSLREAILSEPPAGLIDELARATKRTSFVKGDLRCMPFPDDSFDYVRSTSTYCLYGEDSNVEEAQRVLKPGKKVLQISYGITAVDEEASD